MKVRIIATSDIHGYIMPINYSNNDYTDQGFLSILNTINKYKDEHTMLIDNGDTIHGSPFIKYYYEHKNDNNPINLCFKNYNYVNIGNHDFSFGKNELINYIKDLKDKFICGNVKIDNKRIGPEYIIHSFDEDNKVAIIGCVSQCVLMYESKENINGIEIEDCYEYCKRIIQKIKEREKVKRIIIVYHGGLEKDIDGNPIEKDTGENQGYKMCKDLDFDILISGHQHRSLCCKLFNKVVIQCDANGKEFALIDYDLDSGESTSSLIKPRGYDLKIYNQLLPLEKDVQKWLDETIGIIDNVDLKIKDGFNARLHKHPLVSFINEAQSQLVDSQLSGTALFNDAKGFNKNITIRDLVSTYIYQNNIYKVKINGKQLKEYLEVNARYFDIKNNKICVSEEFLTPIERHFNYDMVDGIEYTIKVGNLIGKRVINIKYNGQDIKDDDEFSLAISNFRYGGSGGFDVLKNLPVLSISSLDMIEVLINYLKQKEITIVNHQDNINIIK